MSRRAEADYKFFIEFSKEDVQGYFAWLEEALPYFRTTIGKAWDPAIDDIVKKIRESL